MSLSGLGLSPDQPEWQGIARADREVIAQAEEAIRVHRRGLAGIFVIGHAFEILQREAMAASNSQNPTGSRYNRAFAALEKPPPELARVSKTDRYEYIWCWNHHEAIRDWWEKQDQRQRDRWNHPHSIMRRFLASIEGPRQRVQKTGMKALDAAVERIEHAADDIERKTGGAAALALDMTPEGMQASIESFVDVYGSDAVFAFITALLAHLDDLDARRTGELVRAFLKTPRPSTRSAPSRSSHKRHISPRGERHWDQ